MARGEGIDRLRRTRATERINGGVDKEDVDKEDERQRGRRVRWTAPRAIQRAKTANGAIVCAEG